MSRLQLVSTITKLRAELAALTAQRDAALAERDAAKAQLAAVQGAAEELSRWPDLSGIEFRALVNGTETIIEPEKVRGIYEGWLRHVETLAPFGKQIVADGHFRVTAEAERDAERARAERAEGVVKAARAIHAHMFQSGDEVNFKNLGAFADRSVVLWKELAAALAASAPNPEGARDGK